MSRYQQPRTRIGRRAATFARTGGYDTQRGTSARSYRSHRQDVAEWAQGTPTIRTEIRETSRDLDMSNPVYQRLLNAAVENVIARGPRVTPSTADPAWNQAAAAIYREHCRQYNFSVEKVLDEHTASTVVYRSVKRDGGALVYHPIGRTQWFEDGQIVTPREKRSATNIKHGVQFARSTGALDGYWVGPYSKYGVVKETDCFFLPAWHIDRDLDIVLPRTAYLYDPRFASQYRGISATAGASEHLERIEEYWEAILERAIQEACVFGVLKTDNPSRAKAGASVGRAADTSTTDGKDIYDSMSFIEPGTVFNLSKEDLFELISTNTPNAQLEMFLKMAIRMVAITLSMPIEVVLIMFDRNFSASRAAIELFKMWARMEKKYMATRWTHWDYTWTIYDAILTGDLTARPDWQSVIISPDGWTYLDPKSEALAIQYRFTTGEATMTEVLAETGRDLRDHYTHRANDYRVAADIAKTTGVPIEIIAPHLFQNMQTPLLADTPTDPNQEPAAP